MKKSEPNDPIRDGSGDFDDRCELDPTKICDNCFRCLEMDTRDYVEIPISRILLGEDELEQYGAKNDFRPLRFVTLKNCRARREM